MARRQTTVIEVRDRYVFRNYSEHAVRWCEAMPASRERRVARRGEAAQDVRGRRCRKSGA